MKECQEYPGSSTPIEALLYDFSEEDFVTRCLENSRRIGTTVFQDVYDSLYSFIEQHPLTSASGLIFKNSYRYSLYDKHISLSEYIAMGSMPFQNLCFDCYANLCTPLDITDIVLPDFIIHNKSAYSIHGNIRILTTKHNLKTKSRNTILLPVVSIRADTLQRIYGKAVNNIRTLLPSKLGVWEWRLSFYDKISGDAFFCECFRSAIEKAEIDVRWRSRSNTHAHIKKAISQRAFMKDLCHMCTGKNSDLFFCHPMYGSQFRVRYGAYIRKLSIEEGISEREAEDRVRVLKGVPKIGERWLNETMLYNYIKVFFAQYEVQREASPPWLGNQRLDFYVPGLNLAIEYQGEQHFKAVDLFGGKQGLIETQIRDKEKFQKCKEQGTTLVYFTYKDSLTEKLVDRRLAKFMSSE